MSAAPYRSGFTRWDEEAWVRCKPRRDAVFDDGLHYFSPELCPLLRHSEVAAAPTEVREGILVHALYLHLEFTVRLETGPVNEVCVMLRSPDFLPWMSRRMKNDALKIYADEGGHAEMTNSLMAAVRDRTGIRPLAHQPAFLRELDLLCAAVPAERRNLVRLLFVIVSETLITRVLTKLPHDESVQRAVRDVAQDHADDERGHHAYFRQLFAYLWPRLSPDVQRETGVLLPRMVRAFLEPDGPALTRVLRTYPDHFGEPERVVAEALQDDRTAMIHDARSFLGMLRASRALDVPQIHAAFRESDLLT